MRIAYIAAGAAGMYCGTCIHDNTVARALIEMGHEVALIPTYTPLRTDEPEVSIDRIFYGAVNVYLEQISSFFRRIHPRLDRFFDRRWLLDRVARFSSSTDARELGALTLSVLRGEEGNQRKELGKLTDFLEDYSPDLVHITNSMFLGFCREIKNRLSVPVVCGLTGEDLFLENLAEPHRGRVQEELRIRSRDADAFIATSRFYADLMTAQLGVADERMHVVPLGVDQSGYLPPAEKESADAPVVIGYLARIAPEKGLHLLVEAFAGLADERREDVRLEVAGYLGKGDADYFESIRRRVKQTGLEDRIVFHGEVDRDEKLRFLAGLDILSVPTTYQEPKGLYILEALGHGVPVVQPRHGAFPELIEATGGGILVDPGSPEALAEGLRALIDDPPLRAKLGRRGRRTVRDRFHHRAMAENTLAVYRRLTDQGSVRSQG